MDTISTILSGEHPWRTVAGGLLIAVTVRALILRITRPTDLPPFYSETPYIPWLGSIVQFATGPREFLQRAASSNPGGCFTVRLFGKSMTFLTGSDGHAFFFRARESEFDIREAYAMTKITFGPGVCYDCPQSKMAQQFAFFKNGLSDECFVRYMALVQEEVSSYFDREWGEAGEACLLSSLSDLFTLTSSRCLLGDEIRARWDSSGMAGHYLALDHSFVPILFFFPWIPNPHRSKCVAARKHFERIFTEVIEERRSRGAGAKANGNGKGSDENGGGNDDDGGNTDNSNPSDFLSVLMEARYRDGTSLSMTEITGIMIGVLLGGQHTSNVTGTWLMAHLLKSPEWLDRVMREQEEIFARRKVGVNDLGDKGEVHGDVDVDVDVDGALLHPATLTYDEVRGMEVFDEVLSETLRLHPPFFQLSRAVHVDKVYRCPNGDSYRIPRGHYVNVSPGAAHRLPELWGPDADDFDPSRFSPENRAKHESHSWIPFGGGMHQCGGRKFAWNSLKCTLAWLLRNYELEFVGDGARELPREDYTTMVVAPTRGHTRVRYRRRRRCAEDTS